MKTIPLSPVDYIFTGVGSQPITFAFLFQTTIDPDALQTSLNETLEYFPVLRSQLIKTSETDYGFHISEDGMTFEVMESDLAFEESRRVTEYISPVRSIEGKPLTKITLTQTPKGSILAVSVSHALADGFSYFHFLSSWARVCRGDSIIKPYLDRDIFLSDFDHTEKTITSDDIYIDCGLFYGGKRRTVYEGRMTDERIFLSDETMRSSIEKAKQEHNLSLTENDVITAHLWKKYIPVWNKENDDPKTYVTCPFDFRRVLTQFPKNYFGCALCFATASVGYHDLLESSIGDLAILIRNSVGKIKKDYILKSLNTLESFRKQCGLAAIEEIHLRHPIHGMIVTNISRLPLRDIDFGSGAPVNFLTYAEVLSSAAILPADKGVEILVVHPPEGN
jgi:shikimate O-hydroxycinnamoyltransferase